LPAAVVEKIVDKFVDEIREKVKAQNVTIILTDTARTWFATKGYSAQFGARSIGRLVQSELKDALADELLFGKLAEGGAVTVDIADGKIKLNYG
jgi:ATP-dependent Clp protease ATP-binding subunit ClpA